MRVTVLGAGSWGTTVASLTAGRNETMVWARDPEVAREINEEHTHSRYLSGHRLPKRLKASADLEESVSRADVLVMGVPSHSFRETLEAAKPFVRPWIPVVSLTKGLETGTMLRMTEVIRDVLPGHSAAALTGPNLAKEIMAGNAAASVVATEDLDVAAALQKVFARGMFRVYINHDVIGCEIGGALKNVVAIATGIAEGLSVGDNTRSAVITRGLQELTRLGVGLGAQPETLAGLAGMGDLIATCISPQSRNRYVGEQLGRGRQLSDILAEMNQVAEGIKTAPVAMALASRCGLAMPITAEIAGIVDGSISPDDAYRGLLRDVKAGHEAEPG
ncbi:MAG: NAD(P)H-dependent glycerol-3-phosphate dehydrogenase [Geodermatophilaceae bacterium]|nr:NAD(P)H-dependent glycerol-3-phosphate dehydrogenase [Geodermatophilaceae bacterium]